MTLSLYIQIVAARAHIERLKAENPPPPPSPSVQATLQTLREAGRPVTTKFIHESTGISERTAASALYKLLKAGQVEREQRFTRGHLTNYWTLVDDAE